MARPIEPTPPVIGQDALQLLESLKNRASDEEVQSLYQSTQQYFKQMEERNAEHRHEILKKEKESLS